MSVNERDPHTGHMLTGHEWNGIKELNTPVPKPVWIFLIAAFLFSVACWILLPAWPLGSTYTKGLLGTDQRDVVTEQVHNAAMARSVWTGKIAAMDYTAIRRDQALMTMVRQDGHRLFGDNCAACHGINAMGSKGYPNLTDRDWLWGGDAETVAQTIRAGINSSDENTRVSQMPSFGRDGMLDGKAIFAVSQYVLSLSNPGAVKGTPAETLRTGAKVFADNCAACHGPKGLGDHAMGAPNLTDNIWLYGGDAQTIYTTIYDGRHGEMPAWSPRLSATDIKILTLYVLDRGGPPQ